MFEREADWAKATTLICNIMRGSSAIEVETHFSRDTGTGRVAQSSSWRYEQTQAHQTGQSDMPRLFTLEGLRETLGQLAGRGASQSYELPIGRRLSTELQDRLSKFSGIDVSFVQLTVGSEIVSWVLVSLSEPRDVILWKLQYHLRDVQL